MDICNSRVAFATEKFLDEESWLTMKVDLLR